MSLFVAVVIGSLFGNFLSGLINAYELGRKLAEIVARRFTRE